MKYQRLSLVFSLFLWFLLPRPVWAQSPPKYEMRAAWVATVENIDWPDKGDFNTESQKASFTRLLDRLQAEGMNTVVVQIRPASDAFYPSPYEPWSQWLTGKQGQPPSPYYDPLQFMIEETHKRGMEFHAWCNPYRAVFSIRKSSIAPTHITKIHPEWFVDYGGTRYFDPGNPAARQFVVNVIRDVVRRYDIDAIHFDDYFYPYRIPGKDFPDDASYQKYGAGMSRDDWRRSNVDSIILHLSTAIKAENPYCKFGISPFGVWRNQDKDPEGSATTAGQTNYDDLYANILLWLKKGWIDYVAPQLYWEFNKQAAPFGILADWWSKHTYGRQCYIGLGMYRAGSNAAWREKDQLPHMIRFIRNYPTIDGAVYFSAASFENNPNGWCDSLKNNYYKYPALPPPMPWIDSTKPMAPIVVKVTGDAYPHSFLLDIKKDQQCEPLKSFIVYAFDKADSTRDLDDVRNIVKIIPASGDASIILPAFSEKDKVFAVTSIDRNNNESEPTMVENE